jgi:hypothetical protein
MLGSTHTPPSSSASTRCLTSSPALTFLSASPSRISWPWSASTSPSPRVTRSTVWMFFTLSQNTLWVSSTTTLKISARYLMFNNKLFIWIWIEFVVFFVENVCSRLREGQCCLLLPVHDNDLLI